MENVQASGPATLHLVNDTQILEWPLHGQNSSHLLGTGFRCYFSQM